MRSDGDFEPWSELVDPMFEGDGDAPPVRMRSMDVLVMTCVKAHAPPLSQARTRMYREPVLVPSLAHIDRSAPLEAVERLDGPDPRAVLREARLAATSVAGSGAPSIFSESQPVEAAAEADEQRQTLRTQLQLRVAPPSPRSAPEAWELRYRGELQDLAAERAARRRAALISDQMRRQVRGSGAPPQLSRLVFTRPVSEEALQLLRALRSERRRQEVATQLA